MYAKGMSTWDIKAHIRCIYGLAVLDTTVSRITDKVLPVAREWQQRPLESVYAVVFLDAIHYHVRSEGQVMKKAVKGAVFAPPPCLYFLSIRTALGGYTKFGTLSRKAAPC